MATEYVTLEPAIKSPQSIENAIELDAGLEAGLNVDLDDVKIEAPPIAASTRPDTNHSR